MAATATLNIRLSESLKSHGLQVLDRAGVSTTQAVRSLFEYMEREQSLPDYMQPEACSGAAERRAALRDFAGSAAGAACEADVAAAKEARLARLVDGAWG
jgi:addiction module RelB/DinJ family antitoxin